MTVLWWAWGLSAVVIVALAMWAGWAATRQFGGILIDTRGRYSLTRLQVALWTVVIVSLLVGVLVARATVAGEDPLGFSIPDTVLAAMGVSLASGVGSITIKAYKNRTRAEYVAASATKAEAGQGPPARVAQIVLVEEGPLADETVDITKFQNLIFTLFLIGAYVVITVHAFRGYGPPPPIQNPADISTLPEFNATFVALLIISHAGYLGGKLPNRGGTATTRQPGSAVTSTPGFSVADRNIALAKRRTGAEAATSIVADPTVGADAGPEPTVPGGVDDLHRRITMLEAEFAELRGGKPEA